MPAADVEVTQVYSGPYYKLTNATSAEGDNYVTVYEGEKDTTYPISLYTYLQDGVMVESLELTWEDDSGAQHIETCPVTRSSSTLAYFYMPQHASTITKVNYGKDQTEYFVAFTVEQFEIITDECKFLDYSVDIYNVDETEPVTSVKSVNNVKYYTSIGNTRNQKSAYSFTDFAANIGDKFKIVVTPNYGVTKPLDVTIDTGVCTYNAEESSNGRYVYDVEITKNAGTSSSNRPANDYHYISIEAQPSNKVTIQNNSGGSVELQSGTDCAEGFANNYAYLNIRPDKGNYVKSISVSYSEDGSNSYEPEELYAVEEDGGFYYQYTLRSVNDIWVNVEFESLEQMCNEIDGLAYDSTDGSIVISSANGLKRLADIVNNHHDFYGVTFKLANDIELSGNWTPIGQASQLCMKYAYGNGGSPFWGNFDGCGHTISGLDVDNTSMDSDAYKFLGLFGYAMYGTISNLTVDGSIVISKAMDSWVSTVGGIAGNAGYANNCVSRVNIKTTDYVRIVGGAFGISGSCTDVIYAGSISIDNRNATNTSGCGTMCVGGITGFISSDSIFTRCGNCGNINILEKKRANSDSTASTWYLDNVQANVGGILGQSFRLENSSSVPASSGYRYNVEFNECFNKGDIVGHFEVAGGIVGKTTGTKTGDSRTCTLNNCYSSGAITQNASGKDRAITVRLGGLVGTSDFSGNDWVLNCTNSYATSIPTCETAYTYMHIGELYGNNSTDGLSGTGIENTVNSYGASDINDANMASIVDADEAWAMGVDGMPYLKWEGNVEDSGKYSCSIAVKTATGSNVASTLSLYSDSARTQQVGETFNLSSSASKAVLNNLAAGSYFYTVSADGYVTENGAISVAMSDKSVTITLHEKAEMSFKVSPADATFTLGVSGSGMTADNVVKTDEASVYTFSNLYADGSYTYIASLDGYASTQKTFCVEDGKTLDCTLSALAQGSAVDANTGSFTITQGGTYVLSPGTYGYVIFVETTEPVVIAGTGITSDAAIKNLYIDCIEGANLTLQDIFISNTVGTANMVNFTGPGNTLHFEGVCVLDLNTTDKGYAAIHVGPDTSLTITGGTLYLYKYEQAAGIGGNDAEVSGAITFKDAQVNAKGSRQGAVIGSGANSYADGASGDIVIDNSTLNVYANARGAAIGGGAGSKGGRCGSVVITNNSVVNIDVGATGAAIGGGGYDGGNDASGGTVAIYNSVLRTYCTSNAATMWDSVSAAGVSTKVVNADIQGKSIVFDLSALGSSDFEIYGYNNDEVDYVFGGTTNQLRYVDEDGTAFGGMTIQNWKDVVDGKVYLYNNTTYDSYKVVAGNLIYDTALVDGVYTLSGSGTSLEKAESSITVTDEGSDTLTSTSALTVTKNTSAEAVGASKTYSVSATAGLTPTASSSDESIATASIEDGKLTVTAKLAGIAKITVSAEETSTLKAPESVTFYVAVAEVSFLGGSLRIDDGNGLATTDYTKTSLRLGYTVKMPTSTTIDGETIEVSNTTWGWSYGLSGDKLNYTRQGENKTDNGDGTFTTNIVFTNIGAANYTSALFASMNLSATVNGQTLNWSEGEVDTRSVQSVAQSVKDSLSESDQARTYADGLLSKIAVTKELWTGNY
jgi:hypothetical protein